ncbi:stimulus-sensing domain-containing protein [Pyruvatibacter mobilis]|uniref:stimulus-sensing domain-containing protein n=1 Tax=Pyruvatibacter mobilis TaxID=1712261 RepID=UPI003BA9F54D
MTDSARRSRDAGHRITRWLRQARGRITPLMAPAMRAVNEVQVRGRFSTLTRRIVAFNVLALALLAVGILYVNQFQAGLIDQRIQNLRAQGEIIAGALAEAATVELETQIIVPDGPVPQIDLTVAARQAPIDPNRAAAILRRLVLPTDARARLYNTNGVIVVDSQFIDAGRDVIAYELPPPAQEERVTLVDWVNVLITNLLREGDVPRYEELPGSQGLNYKEVRGALRAEPTAMVRENDRGQLIVSVAVPVQRFKAVMGALLLSTEGGDIDALVRAERLAVLRVFVVLLVVTVLLAILLAGTIAAPVRRLADAAERVRRQRHTRVEIPDFRDRRDEIGELSGALREMTRELYARIDATERFAADVAHELKNPLTSLRSAIETLSIARDDTARARLTEIINHDVVRLDRLITDISDASRIDAEMSRAEAVPVDLAEVVATFVRNYTQSRKGTRTADIEVHFTAPDTTEPLMADVIELRFGQVLANLVDNAVSFSQPGDRVAIGMVRRGEEIEITIDDTGPGIPPDNIETIFKRFYTDRPDPSAFGNNSGLGLSISRQIMQAHGGSLHAENRVDEAGDITGARFVIRLPAA